MKLVIFNSNDVDEDGTGYTVYNADNFLGLTVDKGPIEDRDTSKWTMYPLLHFRFKYDWMTCFDPLIEPTDTDDNYDKGREDCWVIYDVIENATERESRDKNEKASMEIARLLIKRFMEFLISTEEKVFDVMKELDVVIEKNKNKIGGLKDE